MRNYLVDGMPRRGCACSALWIFASRPKLGHTHATGTGRSPRRQVRLPEDVDAALGAYAAQHHTTPSAVIREAVNDYLANA